MSVEVKETTLAENQNKTFRDRERKHRSAQINNLVQRRNAVTSSATPKGVKDYKRQLKVMITELFPWSQVFMQSNQVMYTLKEVGVSF